MYRVLVMDITDRLITKLKSQTASEMLEYMDDLEKEIDPAIVSHLVITFEGNSIEVSDLINRAAQG